MAETAVTRDRFFGGRLTLAQPAKGHRSGTDAILLAAAVPRDFAGRVHDVGAGVGAVGLGVALACPTSQVTLIENDAEYCALAADNIAANNLAGRVEIVSCDILSREVRRAALRHPADLVVTNPPFHEPGRVRSSPDAGRRAAHVLAGDDGLADWLAACLDCLAAKGTLIVVHRAAVVPALLACLDRRLGEIVVKPIHPRAGEPASRVLVRGRTGSRAPFRIASPLVLHDGGAFTPEAARLHDDAVALDW